MVAQMPFRSMAMAQFLVILIMQELLPVGIRVYPLLVFLRSQEILIIQDPLQEQHLAFIFSVRQLMAILITM